MDNQNGGKKKIKTYFKIWSNFIPTPKAKLKKNTKIIII